MEPMNSGAVYHCPRGTLECVERYLKGFPPYLGSKLFVAGTSMRCIVGEVKPFA